MTTARIHKRTLQQDDRQVKGCNWISHLNPELKLNDITLLGGHDSFTDFDPNNQLSPDIPLPKSLQWLMRNIPFINNITRKQIVKWSEAQSTSAKQQFNAGARYFDLRIAKDTMTGKFYTVHGLFSTDTLKKSLNQINARLDKYKGEMVILDCRSFKNMPTKADHEALVALIKEIFGNKLASSKLKPTSKLEDFQNNNERVIAIYHNSSIASKYDDCLWPAHTISSPWPNKDDVADLEKELDDIIKHKQAAGQLNVTQGVLTPNAGTVIKGTLFGKVPFLKKWAPSSLADLADQANPALSQRLYYLWSKDSVNIIIFDHLDNLGQPFIEEIVERNHDTAGRLGLEKIFDTSISLSSDLKEIFRDTVPLEEMPENHVYLENSLTESLSQSHLDSDRARLGF